MRLRLLGLGFLSALFYHLALPPGPAPWLGWFVLIPLLAAFEFLRPATRQTLRWLALPFGLLWGTLSFFWILRPLPSSDIPAAMMPAALLILVLFMTTIYALAFLWILTWLRDRRGSHTLWIAPLLWVLLEWVRGSGVFAFSWIHLSQTQTTEGGFLAPAGWVGGLGLSFLMVFFQVSLIKSLREKAARWILLAFLLLLLIFRVPTHQDSERTVKLAALQGNVPLELKWKREFRHENFRIFTELHREAAEAGAELTLWPETAIPIPVLWPSYQAHELQLREIARNSGVPIVTGVQGMEYDDKGALSYRNSMLLLGREGSFENIYSKARLLPFGESTAFLDPVLGGFHLDFGQADFKPGGGERVFEWEGLTFSPFICYEMGLSSLTTLSVRRGARLLLNSTNDGWFEGRQLLALHAALSPMRAAESGVPVLRCSNAGITMLLDSRGKRVVELPVGERAVLIAEVAIPSRPSLYARTGAWLPQLLGVLYLLGFLLVLARTSGPGGRIEAQVDS
ncbi:MAG: apolipoprotein N-acyltransferase [Candidatus Krumholzibacteria bacterium]|jgi:apolipoprotein N-acyltransferase|nr:apolipoprotein N-acyltransferase [Candidatus Krumholzibacteria bacterium]MDP6669185.1 apolipoprotein N-acyltransferase [Candidatus Krumholzibacteria bacterium]MDP6798063.1 apolipoprotein N-acyltransferase [Candidatus Krumholzibacteria bacterium]MDP7021255.1 apolipoprotein N-acyltransferase [Candidatus Krumholzibacteria bacterium]